MSRSVIFANFDPKMVPSSQKFFDLTNGLAVRTRFHALRAHTAGARCTRSGIFFHGSIFLVKPNNLFYWSKCLNRRFEVVYVRCGRAVHAKRNFFFPEFIQNWILRGVFEVTFVDMTNRLAARAFAVDLCATENSLKTYQVAIWKSFYGVYV